MVAPYLLMFSMQSLGLPLFVSILLAVLGTILIGYAVDILIYSPLAKRNSSSNVIMVSSIGAMIIIINVVAIIFGMRPRLSIRVFLKVYTIGKILVTYTQVFQFVTALFLFLLFFIFLKFSRFGIITVHTEMMKN
jgi:branched-chain amino acid transport system permease protein